MWWENKGKARVIGNKVRKNQRRLQRSMKLLPLLLAASTLCTLYLLLYGASRTIFSAKPVPPSSTSCTFQGPLPGSLTQPLEPQLRFASLRIAQNACATHRECNGVVYIPWQRDGARFELRGGKKRIASLDGQQAYVLEGCTGGDGPDGDGPRDGRSEEELEDIRRAAVVYSEDMTESFWDGGEGFEERYASVGSFDENGNPTIFIGIASYRDEMCRGTVQRALANARYPWRLFFGVVDQRADGDRPCMRTKKHCKADPDQLLCKHAKQLRVMFVDAAEAKGPTWGRHRADSLYRGEYFAMQIDAHMFFVKDWDQDVVQQWMKTGNEMAVLSTYPR